MNIHYKNENMELHKTFSPWLTCLRNILFLMNALFFAISLFLIGAGIEILIVYKNFDSFLSAHYIRLPQICIAIGVILICSTFFGWFGTIKLNVLSLKLYSALLLLLICVNLTTCITSFFAYNNVDDYMNRKMFKLVKEFEVDENVRRSWNYVQEQYSCCGVHFPENWYGIKGDGVTGGKLLEYRGFTRKYPYSCCVDKSCNEGSIYDEGCANHLIDYVSKALLLSGYSSLVLIVIQAIALIVTYSFGIYIRRWCNIKKVHKHLKGRSIILASPDAITHKTDFV